MTLDLTIFRIKSSSKVVLDDSDRPNRILPMNGLHATRWPGAILLVGVIM